MRRGAYSSWSSSTWPSAPKISSSSCWSEVATTAAAPVNGSSSRISLSVPGCARLVSLIAFIGSAPGVSSQEK